MSEAEFGVVAAVVIVGSLAIAGLVQRHGDDQEHETARQLQGMYQVGRVAFTITGIVLILVGLAFGSSVVVLGGVASLIAGLGQHCAYRTAGRR